MKSKFKKDIVNLTEIKIPDYDIKRDGISQSLILSYLKCRIDFLLKINRYHNPEKSITFTFGSIVHDVLDKIYSYFHKNKKLPLLTDIKIWVNDYNKIDNVLINSEKNKEKIELIKAKAYVILSEYVKIYKNEFNKIKIKGIEKKFDIYWKGYRLKGKKDLCFTINENENWILETKTSGRIDETELLQKISFDFQSLFYTIVEEIELNTKVNGVVYNVIRNPGHKLLKNESIFKLQGRLRREIRKNPEHFFKRYHIPYTLKDKEKFKKELLYKLEEINLLLKGNLKFYSNEKNCITRFSCSYLEACSSGQLVGYTQKNSIFPELE